LIRPFNNYLILFVVFLYDGSRKLRAIRNKLVAFFVAFGRRQKLVTAYGIEFRLEFRHEFSGLVGNWRSFEPLPSLATARPMAITAPVTAPQASPQRSPPPKPADTAFEAASSSSV
jgi:hypothetical protein